MTYTIKPSSASSGVMCLAKSSSRAWSTAASVTTSRKSSSLCARKRRQPVIHAKFFVVEVRDCARRPFGRRLSPPCPVHHDVVERAVDDGAGESGARLRLDAAREAAENGEVAGLQAGGTVRWMLAMSQRRIHACPCLPGFLTSSRAVVSCRSVVVLAQPVSDVT